ncbi:flagellar basal body-associated FliL family protein [Desulfatitalea alkaliphila]|uniref:Flagellar protein FliL n=1 Tax=Desulfatitalea alkaliphila TaxID=2929485 RepID=A0AA41ULA8_9BACT|nr:flagellar basal body-associated FliL family protein [Desulfatitalea alkaliphila]MCJ8501301.1 flagellar basal body-associated FliL family protein [Desulfatitalea alkaliphila]
MSTKTLIIVLSAVVLMVGMMGGGFFLLWHKMSTSLVQMQQQQNRPAGEQGAVGEEEEGEEEQVAGLGPMYTMDTLIVNLADQGGKRYLRLGMQWELSDPGVVQEVDKRMAQLRDAILMILPTKQYADIGSAQGKIDLRDELMARVNSILRDGSVTNIYFTEFVVQ